MYTVHVHVHLYNGHYTDINNYNTCRIHDQYTS